MSISHPQRQLTPPGPGFNTCVSCRPIVRCGAPAEILRRLATSGYLSTKWLIPASFQFVTPSRADRGRCIGVRKKKVPIWPHSQSISPALVWGGNWAIFLIAKVIEREICLSCYYWNYWNKVMEIKKWEEKEKKGEAEKVFQPICYSNTSEVEFS